MGLRALLVVTALAACSRTAESKPPPPAAPATPQTIRVAALKKILDGKHKLLVHASMGADEVLHDLAEAGNLALDPSLLVLAGDDQHAMLKQAADASAYTLVGRIPFVSKKLPAAGLELMVQGDPRLRRPYLVVVAAALAGDAAMDRWLRARPLGRGPDLLPSRHCHEDVTAGLVASR